LDVSATTRAGAQRKDTGKPKGKARGSATKVNWRDPQVWLVLALVAAIGFGAAYSIWMRTWRDDLASEHNFYVATAVARLRELRTQLTVCATEIRSASTAQGATPAVAQLASVAARLDAALTMIPRRGPVQWKAEILGLANAVHTRMSGILQRQLSSPTTALISSLGEAIPGVIGAVEDLDDALTATVISAPSGGKPRLNLTEDSLATLEDAIAAAKTAVLALPE
jgi:hypothetical protein